MSCRLALVGALACALVLGAARAGAEAGPWSQLGLPVAPGGAASGDLLAQRAIDREWGPADDSTYREVEVPGWKSEGLAMALSGVVPGAGHLYLGENGGWAFALSEAAFWLGHWYEVHTERKDYSDLVNFVGNPYDTNGVFSFARYTRVTHHDTNDLERLWQGDRQAFYRELNDNPIYIDGFPAGDSFNAQLGVHDLIDAHDVASRRQWLFDAALWANHLLAALDALRAARSHNSPLREEYHLELGQRWRDGQREVQAAIVRRF